MKKNSPYYHHKYLHNTSDPELIVPEIIKLIDPRSVVDVGCGLGTFLKVFKESGVPDVLGLDGKWVNRDLLHENISENEFIEQDLNDRFFLDRKYDLAICLEVAEHLLPKRAESFIEDLVNAGRIILFSAAIPGQRGTNHINEQWLGYWASLFKEHHYVVHDILKAKFWENPDIHWWYKQNMVLVTPSNYTITDSDSLRYNALKNVIHPELLMAINNKLDSISTGYASPRYYAKLLLKSLIKRLR